MSINQDDIIEDVKLRDYSLDGELQWETPFEEGFYSEESLLDSMKVLGNRAGELGWQGIKSGAEYSRIGLVRGVQWTAERIKKSLVLWRQRRQQKAFATAKYLNDRLKLSKELYSQAQRLSRKIGSFTEEPRKIPHARLWVFKDNQSIPSDLIERLATDTREMGNYFTRVVNTVANQANVVKQMSRSIDISDDTRFEQTVLKPSLELERHAIVQVIPTNGIDFLGNCALVSPSPVDANDFRKTDEFFKTFWRTRRYQFITHRNSTMNDGYLEPSLRDLQSMIQAAMEYLTPLVRSAPKLNGLYDQFTTLQYEIYKALSEVNTDALRVYQKELLSVDQVAEVGLAHVGKIIDPMYTRMQLKALTLIHLVERSLSPK